MGASGAKQEPPATGTGYGGAQARYSAPVLNRGGVICSPKISSTSNFCLFMGFTQSIPQRTDPAQLLAGFIPRAHTGTWLCPPQTSNGDPFLGPGLRLLAEPLSEYGAAGGAARRRAGGGHGTRTRGDSWGEDHALPDGEVPHFGGALGGGRGVAFAQVLQRPLQALALVGAWAAVLGALHVIPGDPWGHRDG